MAKDFINLTDFSSKQLLALLDRAIADKALLAKGKLPASLERKTLAMIFEKPSLRTRVSFETAMTQLGGHAIYMTQADIGLGKREETKDIARVLDRMCEGVIARTFSHELIEELAGCSSKPVVNALTDYSHPCQAMADVMTAKEHFGDLAGKTIVFVGDGNNVARSLAVACEKLDMKFILACPAGYELEKSFTQSVSAQSYGCTNDPVEAVKKADVIYADTWISMGQEEEKQKRLNDFSGFQINSELMAVAPSSAVVMHCLPAYRDYEITDEVFEANAQIIFEEAENRLHFQRSLLNILIAEGGIG